MNKLLCFFKLFIPFYFLFYLSGCSGSIEPEESFASSAEESVNYQNKSNYRSPAEATSIARKNIANFFEASTRSSGITISDDIKIVTKTTTRSYTDTLYYVLNFEDNHGFAIVPAKRNMPEILVMTENGKFTSKELLPPGIDQYIEMAEAKILNNTLGTSDLTPDNDPVGLKKIIIEVDSLINENIRPRSKVQFGQTWPEGYYCPNGYSGCTVTALVQALTHFSYPISFSLSYPERDKDSIQINWRPYRLHYCKSESESCNVSREDHLNIGRLCREIGYVSGASYNSTGTGLFIYKMIPFIKKIGLNITDVNYNYVPNQSIEQIKNGGIIIMSGWTVNLSPGHTWIIDGYKHHKWRETTYVGDIDANGNVINKEFRKSEVYENWFSHINWGWNGQCNGFFLDGVFDVSESIEPDFNSDSNSTWDFSWNIQYHIITR